MITTLSHFEKKIADTPLKSIVVAAAEDDNVLKAVHLAYQKNIVTPVLVGNQERIQSICKEFNLSFNNIEIINEPDQVEASKIAVKYVKENSNCILMKGLVKSAQLLKAVIHKENGLLTGQLLSHVGLIESSYYHKLIGITDAAINIYPDFQHKIEIIKNAVLFFNKLGYPRPRVAILSAIEKKNDKIESSVHAQEIKQYFIDEKIEDCVVDGPLALDNAVSKEAALNKGIESEVAGDADILVTPNIDSGNILYKTLNFLGGAVTAGLILGASVPIIFTSRADSEKTKLMSITLASSI